MKQRENTCFTYSDKEVYVFCFLKPTFLRRESHSNWNCMVQRSMALIFHLGGSRTLNFMLAWAISIVRACFKGFVLALTILFPCLWLLREDKFSFYQLCGLLSLKVCCVQEKHKKTLMYPTWVFMSKWASWNGLSCSCKEPKLGSHHPCWKFTIICSSSTK